MYCPFCNSSNIYSIKEKKKIFWRCNYCHGIFLDSQFFLKPSEQKKRYDCHNNNVTDSGYRKFLEDFIFPVFLYIKNPIATVLDFGCGPCDESGISNLNQVVIDSIQSHKIELVQWDPYFYPDENSLKKQYDLVFCLEVAEHFENPEEGFCNLSRVCKAGGFVAIGTMLVPDTDTTFKKWWYKNDSTHVAFYSLPALKACASKAGLELVAILTKRCFLFIKK